MAVIIVSNIRDGKDTYAIHTCTMARFYTFKILLIQRLILSILKRKRKKLLALFTNYATDDNANILKQ